MIASFAKFLSLLGLCAPTLPDDRDLQNQFRRVRIAAEHHNKVSEKITASALNTFQELETDTRLAATKRDAKNMEETVDAIVREMQGRK